MKKGFSLIELLVSLIIISLILASFVPVYTKKLKNQNATLTVGGINNIKNCPDNCAKCDKGECLKCNEGYGLINKSCVQCEEGCLKCEGSNCLLCKEGYSLNEGKCVKGACIKIGNICVQRFNAGDPGGLEIPLDLVEVISAQQTSQWQEHARAICYVGKTANNCNAIDNEYSGCNRTICSWYAATKICAHYGLRLPTASEAAFFGQKAQELKLCSDVNNTQISRCESSQRCIYSDGACNPSGLWCQRTDGKLTPPNSNSNPRNGGVAYNFSSEWFRVYHTDESPGYHTCNSGALSVRCVQDL